MSLKDAIDRLKFDVRMQEKNLGRGTLSESELQGHLQGLDDVASKAATVSLEMTEEEPAPAVEAEQPAPATTNPENLNGFDTDNTNY